MHTPRYLIDITTSREYKGHNPVGIVRTEREIIKAFLASTHEVAFFRFDANRKILCAISREESLTVVDSSKNAMRDDRSSRVSLPDPDTTADRPLQAYLADLRERLLAPAEAVSQSYSLAPVHDEELELFDGDVIISAGLLWDGNFLELIYTKKQKDQIILIQVIYDIVPIIMPEFCVPGMNIRFPKFLLDTAWTADAIYCISDSTLSDTDKYLQDHDLPRPKLLRMELGAERSEVRNSSISLSRTLTSGQYVLYVSTIEPRKNHAMLFHIWRTLYERDLENLVPLVFVGRHGWNSSDLISMMQASEHLYPNYIKIMTEVSDNDLDWLYKNASFTVYPSLYEGWGLPVAESLARGKLCIAASTSSLPEAGASFAELIDPLDTVAWMRSIQHFLRNPREIEMRNRTISEHYQVVSWDDAMSRFVSSVSHFAEYENRLLSDDRRTNVA